MSPVVPRPDDKVHRWRFILEAACSFALPSHCAGQPFPGGHLDGEEFPAQIPRQWRMIRTTLQSYPISPSIQLITYSHICYPVPPPSCEPHSTIEYHLPRSYLHAMYIYSYIYLYRRPHVPSGVVSPGSFEVLYTDSHWLFSRDRPSTFPRFSSM